MTQDEIDTMWQQAMRQSISTLAHHHRINT